MGGTVRLADVARRAGVSLSTASRVIGGGSRTVQPELRERVLRAAAELGYSVNVQARAVAKGTSSTVGVIVGDLADPYYSAIASGVIDVAVDRGLVVTISAAGPDPDQAADTVSVLKGQRPRAVIITGTRRRPPADESRLVAELASIERLGGRVCFVGSAGQPPPRPGPAGAGLPPGVAEFRMVPVRNRDGGARMADALVDLGYRDFLVLAGDADLITPSERTAGFAGQARLRGVEIPQDRIVTSAFSRDGAITALRRALRAGVRPDCVFAVTDVMAVGAMTALREWELRPGLDLGVAGFDDIGMLQDVTPSLTTVALPLAGIGARALELALDDGDTSAALTAPFTGRVVLRGSTPGHP